MQFRTVFCLAVLLTLILLTAGGSLAPAMALSPAAPLADDPSPPGEPVKLIFVHHSTGGNWLADETADHPSGGLGQALMGANYYVSATNYGWGPDSVGDRTDIPNWPEWFTGPNSATYLSALYNENGQNVGDYGAWSRLSTDPGGENEIIMLKSCFPNSDLYGNPDDPPLAEPNDQYTVANAKAVYNNILTYFATRQDKLFVVIAAPPLMPSETSAERAANARAFNTWLLNNWLVGYEYNNVAVYDYYNVLTSNGGDVNTNDAGEETGNHHRWWNGAVQHVVNLDSNYSAYPSGDSHPTSAGHRKATVELVQILNVYYDRWQGGATPAPTLDLTAPNGSESWPVNSQQQIQWNTTGTVNQVNLSYSTDDFASSDVIAFGLTNNGSYAWTIPNDPSTTAQVRVESVVSPTTVYDVSAACFTIQEATTDSLTITSPNGGENWLVNSQQQIQWSSAGSISQVDLSYSTDGFASSHTIASGLDNSGSYNWTTPITPTTSARVRVAEVGNPSLYDDSNSDFTLYQSSAFSITIYLPIVMRNYSSQTTCPYPLTGVIINGPTSASTLGSLAALAFSHTAPQALSFASRPAALAVSQRDASQSPAEPLAVNQPSNLTAVHRSGQTFLTWTEEAGLSDEGYHVYRHTTPINAGNIAQATRLTERWGPLPEGSSIFYTDRDREASACQFTGLQNYIIIDLGPELDDATGLFVWTNKESGDFYYAVTTVDGGVEDTSNFSAENSLAAAVAETIADPEPILVWQATSGNGRVYTQFMDFETFNPTYERPCDHPDGGLQYAYNYWVGMPTSEQCGGSLPAQLPLYLHIEGYGSRYGQDIICDQSPWGWCAIEVWNDDPRQSWYYGFSETFDYRTGTPGETIPDSGPIVNYAEERLLRSLYDIIRNPDYSVDEQRIYVYGHSMGGSGAIALAIRYPNVFAASYSSEPMTNYQTSGDGGGDNFRADGEIKWGSVASNFPIDIRGRYATHLQSYAGTGIWDWQNHQANFVNRAGDDMAYITLAHGTLDTVIEWSTQAQPVYGQFYAGHRAFAGATVESGHGWQSFSGLGPNLPWTDMVFRRDESIPAFSNASDSLPVPPTTIGGYNQTLMWSSSWNDWDGAPTDQADRWQISVCSVAEESRTCGSGVAQTVDITPRRLQNFVVTPGAGYNWENRRVSDDGLVDSGSITADVNGLLTAPNFAVSPAGNRLALIPAGGPMPASLNLTAPTSSDDWTVGSQQQVQWSTTGTVAQVNLSYSTDGFSSSETIASAINNTGSYAWTIPNDSSTTVQVRVESVLSPTTVYDVSDNFTISQGGSGETYAFTATIAPGNATQPVTYTWSPAPASGQGTTVATYQWDTDGVYQITVSAENCGGTVQDTHTITIGTSSTCPSPLTGVTISEDQPTSAAYQASPNAPQATMNFQDGVSPTPSYTGTSDVILADDAEDNANLGGTGNLEVFLGDSEHRRSLLRWDISSLPDDITIQAATLELYLYENGASADMQVSLYRMTSEWVEGTGHDLWPGAGYTPDGATWLTSDGSTAWTTPGGDYDATVIGQTTLPQTIEPGWLRVDATTAVQAWVDSGLSNYGLALIPTSGEYIYHYFHSREATTATLRPRLVITYSTGAPQPILSLTAPTGGEDWVVGSQQQIQWNITGTVVAQVNLSYSTDDFVSSHDIATAPANTGSYDWTIPNDPSATVQVRVESVFSPTTVYDISDNFTISEASSSGYTRTLYAIITPGDATQPVTYTWSPVPDSGQGTSTATFHWEADGVYVISVQAQNCGGAYTVQDTHTFTVGTPPTSTSDLDVTLTVENLLDAQQADEPVTFGVPISRDLDLIDLSSLRLLNGAGQPVAVQFTLLARWGGAPDNADEPVRWLLLDFQADAPANGSAAYRLVDSGGATPSYPTLSVTDGAVAIVVNTGAAQFSISKTDGRLTAPNLSSPVFGRATLGGSIQSGDLLSSAAGGGYAAQAAQLTAEGEWVAKPGTVFGKALQPLDSGSGLIYVFVTLQ